MLVLISLTFELSSWFVDARSEEEVERGWDSAREEEEGGGALEIQKNLFLSTRLHSGN